MLSLPDPLRTILNAYRNSGISENYENKMNEKKMSLIIIITITIHY